MKTNYICIQEFYSCHHLLVSYVNSNLMYWAHLLPSPYPFFPTYYSTTFSPFLWWPVQKSFGLLTHIHIHSSDYTTSTVWIQCFNYTSTINYCFLNTHHFSDCLQTWSTLEILQLFHKKFIYRASNLLFYVLLSFHTSAPNVRMPLLLADGIMLIQD